MKRIRIVLILSVMVICSCLDLNSEENGLTKSYQQNFDSAWALMNNGNAKDALELFTNAINEDPAKYSAYIGRAYAYFDSDNSEKGFMDLDKALAISKNYDTTYAAGNIYAMKGNSSEAIKYLNTAISLNNTFEANERIGRIYLFQLKKNEEALLFLKKAIEIQANMYGCYHLGIAYSRLLQFDKAMEQFSNAKKMLDNSGNEDKWLSDNLKWAIDNTSKKVALEF
jgi:Tfp pilus assembly protein PilF